MIAVVNLGEPVVTGCMSVRGIQDVMQWIFPPRGVEGLLPSEGLRHHSIGRLTHNAPPLRAGVFRQPIELTFPPAKARYIQLIAKGMKTCPPGHDGAGRPAWLFVDEIVVE